MPYVHTKPILPFTWPAAGTALNPETGEIEPVNTLIDNLYGANPLPFVNLDPVSSIAKLQSVTSSNR